MFTKQKLKYVKGIPIQEIQELDILENTFLLEGKIEIAGNENQFWNVLIQVNEQVFQFYLTKFHG